MKTCPVLIFLLPFAASASILFHADWEDGVGSTEAFITDGLYAYESSTGGVVEVVREGGKHPQPRAGEGMLYIEIDKTDGDFGCNGCKRIELKTDPFVRDMPFEVDNGMSVLGDTFWYAWSVYVPVGQGPDGKRIMGQWVSRWQNGGYNEGGTMGLEMTDGSWNLAMQRGRDPYRGRIVDLGPVANGTWTDWVFQIRWDMDAYEADNADGESGFVRVWKNGILIDDNSDGFTDVGVNAFNFEDPDEAPFLKFGVYKGSDRVWVPDRHIAYYDELRIGDSSATYADMAPGGDGPAPTPSIVISPARVSVPEGQTQTISVTLTGAPDSEVTLAIEGESGDSDLTAVVEVPLVFDQNNWQNPQTFSIRSANDADALNGSATFRLRGEGLLDGVLTAVEEDSDALSAADGLPPVADTFVRGGANSEDNYGTAGVLRAKNGSGEAFDREIYLKFDLSDFDRIPVSAALILREVSTTAGTFSLHAVENDAWTETGLTWNSPESTLGEALTTVDLPGDGSIIQIDVSDYVRAEAVGDGIASFGIWAGGDYWVDFASRETEDGPVLAFTFGDETSSIWAGFPKASGGDVDTGDWIGWITVAGDYVYLWSLANWAYLPELAVTTQGAWAYVIR